MIKHLAAAMTSFLVHEDIIDEQDFEVYQYGTEHILINLLTMLLIIVCAMIFDMWLEMIFFVIGMMPLRITAGGYHAKTRVRCAVLTGTVFLTSLYIISLMETRMTIGFLASVMGFIIIVVFVTGPVDHVNRRLTNDEYRIARRLSVGYVTLVSLICLPVFMFIDTSPQIVTSIYIGLLAASLSMVFGKVSRKDGD